MKYQRQNHIGRGKRPKTQQRLLEMLDSGYHYTIEVLRSRTGLNAGTLRTHLRILQEQGKIQEIPKSGNTFLYVRSKK